MKMFLMYIANARAGGVPPGRNLVWAVDQTLNGVAREYPTMTFLRMTALASKLRRHILPASLLDDLLLVGLIVKGHAIQGLPP